MFQISSIYHHSIHLKHSNNTYTSMSIKVFKLLEKKIKRGKDIPISLIYKTDLFILLVVQNKQKTNSYTK